MKSGNLNFLEPSEPLQACNGTALPLPLHVILLKASVFLFLLLVQDKPRKDRCNLQWRGPNCASSLQLNGSGSIFVTVSRELYAPLHFQLNTLYD